METSPKTTTVYSEAAVWLAVTASLLFGHNLGVFNTAIAVLSHKGGWCLGSASLACPNAALKLSQLQAALFFGAAIGCLVAGRVASYGRVRALQLTHALYLLGSAGCVGLQSFPLLFASRILIGTGVGFTTVVVPLLISEVTTPAVAGARGALHQLMITVGIWLSITLGLFLSQDATSGNLVTAADETFTTLMLLCPTLLSIVAIIAASFFDETPFFLIANHEQVQAFEVLKRIHGSESIAQCHLADLLHLGGNEEDATAQTDVELASNASPPAETKKLSTRRKRWTLLGALQNDWQRNPMVIGWVLSVGQQISGINVFIGLSNQMFIDSGLSGKTITIASSLMAFLNLVMTVPALLFVDRLGRRMLLIIGTLGQGVSLAIAPITMSFLPEAAHGPSSVLSVLLFVSFYASCYAPVLAVYLPEIFPWEVKEMALGIAGALSWISSMAVVTLAGIFAEPEFLGIKFSIFSLSSLVVCLFAFAFMKETARNRTPSSSRQSESKHEKQMEVSASDAIAGQRVTKVGGMGITLSDDEEEGRETRTLLKSAEI